VPAGLVSLIPRSRPMPDLRQIPHHARRVGGILVLKTITALADSPHNRALLYDPMATPDGWSSVKAHLAKITNPVPANGGGAAETVALASGRADQLVQGVTGRSRLRTTKTGTAHTRHSDRSRQRPRQPASQLPLFQAPGMITVMCCPSSQKAADADAGITADRTCLSAPETHRGHASGGGSSHLPGSIDSG